MSGIYDADARVFEAHLYLTPSDIRNLRFNDRFHILGAAYKLTEVSGYQIGTGESTLCKFLRDLGRSTVGACQNIPSSRRTRPNHLGTSVFDDGDLGLPRRDAPVCAVWSVWHSRGPHVLGVARITCHLPALTTVATADDGRRRL